MSLLERLQGDMKAAMKAREKTRLSTIRMLIAGVKNARIAKGDDLVEAEEVDLLAREAKRRRESIEAFRGAGRDELAATEAAELAVIETYLPAPLSEDEVRALVAEAVSATGAETMRDMGRVMGRVMPAVRGRFPGKAVKPLVEAVLKG